MKAFQHVESAGIENFSPSASFASIDRSAARGAYRLNPSFQRREDGAYAYAIHRPEGCTSWRVLPAHRAWSTLHARLASHPAAAIGDLEAALDGSFSTAVCRALLAFAVDAGILIPPPVLQ